MAELEVIKHTKKAYKLLSDKQLNIWHKSKEFAIEIFIIVFAISLTLWFHELAEHRHEKEIEKRFLTGLYNDVHAEVKEMRDDSAYLALQYHFVDLCNTLTNNDIVTDDSLQHFMEINAPLLYAMSLFQPNHGRYEGFKSAGHLRLIDDDLLGDKIISFYEEGVPNLVYIERMYIDFKLANFDTYNLRKDDTFLDKSYLRKYFLYTRDSLLLIQKENNQLLKEAQDILRLLNRQSSQ